MNIKTVETIEKLKAFFGLSTDGLLFDPNLDIIETDFDLFSRSQVIPDID